MTAGRELRCPTCRRTTSADAKPFPFCSERCRLLDLAKWLGEEYRIADEASAIPDDSSEN
jgi:endogenous inhibitor of DNA gyrase (YacG/DUF329 family)